MVKAGKVAVDSEEYIENTCESISHKENYAMAECDMLIPDDNDVDPDNVNPVFIIINDKCEILEEE